MLRAVSDFNLTTLDVINDCCLRFHRKSRDNRGIFSCSQRDKIRALNLIPGEWVADQGPLSSQKGIPSCTSKTRVGFVHWQSRMHASVSRFSTCTRKRVAGESRTRGRWQQLCSGPHLRLVTHLIHNFVFPVNSHDADYGYLRRMQPRSDGVGSQERVDKQAE